MRVQGAVVRKQWSVGSGKLVTTNWSLITGHCPLVTAHCPLTLKGAMMAVKSYSELIAWQKAMDLAVRVYTATKSFPKTEIYGLTSQLRRAAVSIPSNIAEGQGRHTTKEFLRFLGIAYGSGGTKSSGRKKQRAYKIRINKRKQQKRSRKVNQKAGRKSKNKLKACKL